MMKKVSSGECCHVVQMVGCVSTALPLALALEFVPFGDLLSYLKYWREKVRTVAHTHLNNDLAQALERYGKLCTLIKHLHLFNIFLTMAFSCLNIYVVLCVIILHTQKQKV